jgi:hypothetical protein
MAPATFTSVPSYFDPVFAFFAPPAQISLASDAGSDKRVNFAFVMATTINNVPYTFYDSTKLTNCYLPFDNLTSSSGAPQQPIFVQYYPSAPLCSSQQLQGTLASFSQSIGNLGNYSSPESLSINIAAAGMTCIVQSATSELVLTANLQRRGQSTLPIIPAMTMPPRPC